MLLVQLRRMTFYVVYAYYALLSKSNGYLKTLANEKPRNHLFFVQYSKHDPQRRSRAAFRIQICCKILQDWTCRICGPLGYALQGLHLRKIRAIWSKSGGNVLWILSICLKLVYIHDSGATYGITDTLGKDMAKVIAFALFMRFGKRHLRVK
jgi:hypothetical protein